MWRQGDRPLVLITVPFKMLAVDAKTGKQRGEVETPLIAKQAMYWSTRGYSLSTDLATESSSTASDCPESVA